MRRITTIYSITLFEMVLVIVTCRVNANKYTDERYSHEQQPDKFENRYDQQQRGENGRFSSHRGNSHDDQHFPALPNNELDQVESCQEKDRRRLLHDVEKKKNLIMFGLDGNDLNDHSLKLLVVKLLKTTGVKFESSEVVTIQRLPKTRFPHQPILVKLVSGSLQSMIIRNKSKLHQYNIRLENDLDSKTIRKQKRLVPLRNKLLEAHLPRVFIRYGKLFVENKVLNSEEVERYAQQYGVKLAPK